MNAKTSIRSYNLFQRKSDRDLYCAVSEDRPVPGFLSGEAWEYRRTIVEHLAAPSGFKLDAAEAASRLTGFYLFMTLRS